MIDIDKLNRMLDETLASESAESLNLWMEEQIRADQEAGILRTEESVILHSEEMNVMLSDVQKSVIENGMTENVSYYRSNVISDEFEIESGNVYNFAA